MWQHALQAWIASGKTSIVFVGTNEHNQDCTESATPVSIEKRLGMHEVIRGHRSKDFMVPRPSE
jgi:hypothetical protein